MKKSFHCGSEVAQNMINNAIPVRIGTIREISHFSDESNKGLWFHDQVYESENKIKEITFLKKTML